MFCYKISAVDLWAVGVIMLSLLSQSYPFFQAPDDVTALAEIITLFGDEQIKTLAKIFGKYSFHLNPNFAQTHS